MDHSVFNRNIIFKFFLSYKIYLKKKKKFIKIKPSKDIKITQKNIFIKNKSPKESYQEFF